ncbi:hypothetical protein LTR15_005586 [Elasticomyces elasticus]|nr:hypothetical protein LTR15_005586 [Elasticomyces elasticus]
MASRRPPKLTELSERDKQTLGIASTQREAPIAPTHQRVSRDRREGQSAKKNDTALRLNETSIADEPPIRKLPPGPKLHAARRLWGFVWLTVLAVGGILLVQPILPQSVSLAGCTAFPATIRPVSIWSPNGSLAQIVAINASLDHVSPNVVFTEKPELQLKLKATTEQIIDIERHLTRFSYSFVRNTAFKLAHADTSPGAAVRALVELKSYTTRASALFLDVVSTSKEFGTVHLVSARSALQERLQTIRDKRSRKVFEVALNAGSKEDKVYENAFQDLVNANNSAIGMRGILHSESLRFTKVSGVIDGMIVKLQSTSDYSAYVAMNSRGESELRRDLVSLFQLLGADQQEEDEFTVYFGNLHSHVSSAATL